MEHLEMKEIESAVEAILFASGEPVQTERICVALEIDQPTVEQVLQRLMDYYAYERRGIRLLHIEDSWQMCSSPDYADLIRKAFEIRKPAKLSQPALEVLTIIAYYQPTTRAYVDQIRGVDSAYTIGQFIQRGAFGEHIQDFQENHSGVCPRNRTQQPLPFMPPGYKFRIHP